MKLNLANVYAFLLDTCGEQYTVTYCSPPTYLQSIVGREELADNKIVFVCLEERGGNQTSVVSPPGLALKKSDTDLDLSGSPLKDDCTIDEEISTDIKISNDTPWKLEEECHRGFDLDKARKIICNEQFQSQNSFSDINGSIWILCKGTSYDKTMLLQYEFSPGLFSRGIVSFLGLTPASTLTSVQPLLKKHYTSIRPGTAIDTFVENVYKVKSHITIRCSWSTSAALPALIDLTCCDVVLSQVFRLSDCGLLTQELFNQLRILTRIREDILAYKMSKMENMEPIYRCGYGIDKDELNENINKIMTEVSGFADNTTSTEIENDIEAVIRMSKMRQLSDLTDKLWDLLKRCSSYKELKTAFQLLFQMAVRCNIVNTPTNKNRLAEIITEVSNRRLALPCLTGTEPLEILLEIGLEKLYKDYEFIFMQSKICSPNSLKKIITTDEGNVDTSNSVSTVRKSLRNAIRQETTTPRKTLLHNTQSGLQKQASGEMIGFQNSYFDENDTAKQISRLLHIHCTLEHLLMIQINLNLQNVYGDICEQLLKRPFKPYSTNIDESFTDEIEISMPAHYIREHLEGKEPHSRRISLKSRNKFRQTKTTFYYNIEKMCPPGISELIENNEKEISKECLYYSWIYQKIQTKK